MAEDRENTGDEDQEPDQEDADMSNQGDSISDDQNHVENITASAVGDKFILVTIQPNGTGPIEVDRLPTPPPSQQPPADPVDDQEQSSDFEMDDEPRNDDIARAVFLNRFMDTTRVNEDPIRPDGRLTIMDALEVLDTRGDRSTQTEAVVPNLAMSEPAAPIKRANSGSLSSGETKHLRVEPQGASNSDLDQGNRQVPIVDIAVEAVTFRSMPAQRSADIIQAAEITQSFSRLSVRSSSDSNVMYPDESKKEIDPSSYHKPKSANTCQLV